MKLVSDLPDDHKRIYRVVLFLGIANFVAFVVHTVTDGTCAFPGGGRLVVDHYLVRSHGKDISFTPFAYWFSYLHGVVALLIHLACMIAVWYLRRQSPDDTNPA